MEDTIKEKLIIAPQNVAIRFSFSLPIVMFSTAVINPPYIAKIKATDKICKENEAAI